MIETTSLETTPGVETIARGGAPAARGAPASRDGAAPGAAGTVAGPAAGAGEPSFADVFTSALAPRPAPDRAPNAAKTKRAATGQEASLRRKSDSRSSAAAGTSNRQTTAKSAGDKTSTRRASQSDSAGERPMVESEAEPRDSVEREIDPRGMEDAGIEDAGSRASARSETNASGGDVDVVSGEEDLVDSALPGVAGEIEPLPVDYAANDPAGEGQPAPAAGEEELELPLDNAELDAFSSTFNLEGEDPSLDGAAGEPSLPAAADSARPGPAGESLQPAAPAAGGERFAAAIAASKAPRPGEDPNAGVPSGEPGDGSESGAAAQKHARPAAHAGAAWISGVEPTLSLSTASAATVSAVVGGERATPGAADSGASSGEATLTAVTGTARDAAAARETSPAERLSGNGLDVSQPRDRWSAQLAHALKSQLNRGSSQLTLHLRPPRLGQLDINLALRGNHLRLSIEVESNAVRHLLSSGSGELRESLREAGIEMERVRITVVNRDERPALEREGAWGGGNGRREPGQGQGRAGSEPGLDEEAPADRRGDRAVDFEA